MSLRACVPVALALVAFAAPFGLAQTQGGIVGGVVSGGVGPLPVPAPGAQNALPPRDPRLPINGTGRISGLITSAESGRPLRRATVRLVGGPGVGMRTVSTDAEGRYMLTDLPAARYTVMANHTGYVQMSYGQKRPNGSATQVTVQDKATTVHVDIALPTAGVITGRILDEYGEPIADVSVFAMRRQFFGGERRLVPGGAPATTNDIGEFRIHSLAPGDYFISATLRSVLPGTADRNGYAPTYYPSTTSQDVAQAVSVHASETLSNIVLTLTPSRLSRVSGFVVGADGQLVQGGNVMAMSRGGVQFANANGIIRPDGSFEIGGLADGEYSLRAMTGPMMFGPASGGRPPQPSTATVSIAGNDLSNVVLRPPQPVVLTGRVTGDAATLAAIRPGLMQVLAGRLSSSDVVGPPPPPARLGDDFTFELPVYAGRVSLRGQNLNGTLIESVRWHGIDVTRGFDVTEGAEGDGVEIMLTNRAAKLTVTVNDAQGAAVPNCDVVIFTTDETWWGAGMPGHSSVGRTSEEGRYESSFLLEGSYFVVAVDGLEISRAGDPEFLESLRRRAQRVTLATGDSATIQVTNAEF